MPHVFFVFLGVGVYVAPEPGTNAQLLSDALLPVSYKLSRDVPFFLFAFYIHWLLTSSVNNASFFFFFLRAITQALGVYYSALLDLNHDSALL